MNKLLLIIFNCRFIILSKSEELTRVISDLIMDRFGLVMRFLINGKERIFYVRLKADFC